MLAALDSDADVGPRESERGLASDAKVAAVAGRLGTPGVPGSQIEGEVAAEPVSHGVAGRRWATRECCTCHSAAAVGLARVELSAALPAGIGPADVRADELRDVGRLEVGADGRLGFAPARRAGGFYLPGRDRGGWVDVLGLLAILAVLLGVGVHGGLRWRAARRHPRPERLRQSVYMYSTYERFWHWLQALAILGLLLTGLAIHLPDLLAGARFPAMVRVHDVLGFVLLANAVFAAFYHLASGEIRQYLPRPRGFFSDAIAQLVYYGRGIFRHEPHPFAKSPEEKLNPLQKVTYLVILNVLLPLQLATGLLMWSGPRFPATTGWVGGLGVLAPVHALLAWLFAAFLLLHLYLTTTGHTPTASVRAMVSGWEEVDVEPLNVWLEAAETSGSRCSRGTEPLRPPPRPNQRSFDTMSFLTRPTGPRPYLNPYLSGALLGAVLFLSFFLTGNGLGASGGLSHLTVWAGGPGRARPRGPHRLPRRDGRRGARPAQ